MDTAVRLRARIGQRALLLTTAAVPLTGWAVHAIALHKQLTATRKDPLTGLLRRDAYTARARRLLTRHGDTTAVVMVDADHFSWTKDSCSCGVMLEPSMQVEARCGVLGRWAAPRVIFRTV
ncbi:hypothetical protein [Streptomyces benahoarensis]|uniref:hypothetical protein n=1 Tax=Streptomyces benahoarensis TaxID=2595054 RepID=UPI00203514E6|nr:hypothetical protein [Streptomyces benahoarensis]